jgi:hypothetical protein
VCEQQHAPIDDGDDGCVPGEQQPGGEMGDPVVGQLRVALGSVKEIGDDRDVAVATNPAPALDQGAQVAPQRLQAAACDSGFGHLLRLDLPPAEVLAVLDGHSEQLADHKRRQRKGHDGVEVGRGPAAVERVEQRVDDRLNARPEALHATGRQ